MRSVLLIRVAVAAAVLLLLFVGVVFAAGALLRGRATSQAAARGIVLDVERTRLGWFAAHFKGVQVGLEGVQGLSIKLDTLDVELDHSGRPTRVVARAGNVRVEGDPERVLADVRAWRERHSTPAPIDKTSTSPERSSPSIDVSELDLSTPFPGGGTLTAKGVGVERNGEGTKLVAADVRAQRGDARAFGSNVRVSLNGQKLRQASIDSLALELGPAAQAPSGGPVASASASASAGAPSAALAGVEPPPPTLPPLSDRRGRKRGTRAEAALSAEPLRIDLPDVAPLRGRAVAVARAFSESLDDGAEVSIAALSIRLQSGAEKLTLGPGKAGVMRTPEHVELQFSSTLTEPAKGGTPLSARLELPLQTGQLRATLSGGPVTLSTLGVQEGAFGIIDVTRAQLSGKGSVMVDAQGSMTFDADLTGRSVGLERAWLARGPVHGLDVGLRLAGLFESKRRLRIDDAEGVVGALRARFRGTLESEGERARLAGTFEVPASACQSLLESVPDALMPTLRGARLAGTFEAVGRVSLDSSAIDDLDLAYRIDDRCKFVEVARAIDRERFRKPFQHRIVKPDGTEAEMPTGPGSANWTPLELISPYMQAAVLTTEDGAFFKHHGFNHAAIKSSIIANLKAKRFVRGASTISMQLAKNLFLSRQKTVSRKLEEVVLTDYLEQTFSKEELIELYLNVVEFGPNLYGVTGASEHYFGRKPEELNLAESMFLATLLPRPVDSHKMYERGAISEGWAKNLRSLIEIAFRTGKVSEAERNEGLAEEVVFHREGQPRPPPRAAIGGGHFGNLDEEWKVVE